MTQAEAAGTVPGSGGEQRGAPSPPRCSPPRCSSPHAAVAAAHAASSRSSLRAAQNCRGGALALPWRRYL